MLSVSLAGPASGAGEWTGLIDAAVRGELAARSDLKIGELDDLSPVVTVTELRPGKDLKLIGFYNTSPERLYFDTGFRWRDDAWAPELAFALNGCLLLVTAVLVYLWFSAVRRVVPRT